jgi:peptide deformylase
MKLPLTYYGNPILRKKCEPIESITDEIKQLVADMIHTLDTSNCIGLAAPQVGRPIRLFVMRRYLAVENGKWKLSDPYVFINPQLTVLSKQTQIDDEACASIPGLRLPVERPMHLRIESTNLKGEKVVEEIEGYHARVIMHENDHINGVLYIDRVDPKLRKQAEPILRDIKKKYQT